MSVTQMPHAAQGANAVIATGAAIDAGALTAFVERQVIEPSGDF
jgi:hypothetical protein